VGVTTIAGRARTKGTNDAAAAEARLDEPWHIALLQGGDVAFVEGRQRVLRVYRPTAGVVDRLAGHPSLTKPTDGDALCASLSKPAAMVAGPQGALYVTAIDHHVIYKVDLTARRMLPFAGTGLAGTGEGPRRAARLNKPYGLAFDKNGALFVSCHGDHKIRKITAAGVSAFAGFVRSWGDSRTPTLASFNQPSGMVFDSQGQLLIADYGNRVIRKIATNGAVSTWAGQAYVAGFTDGKAGAARFRRPHMLAIDGQDQLYVTDTDNFAIRKVSPTRDVTTLTGGTKGFQDGAKSQAQFHIPWGVIVAPNGQLLVSDTHNHRIRRVTSAGAAFTFLGAGTAGGADGPRGQARLSGPVGLVYVAKTSSLYWLDHDPGRLRRLKLCPP